MRKPTGKFFTLLFCTLFLTSLTVSSFGQNMFRKINDFDGDGKADFAITRDIEGYRYWYIWQSTNGFRIFQWGITNDQNASGDYDGDGKTDFAIFRVERATPGPQSARLTFWVYGSQAGVKQFQLNNTPDRPYTAHQQDYDGDGKTDYAMIYGPNNQPVLDVIPSTGGLGWGILRFGPYIKTGDMIGDNRADYASFQLTSSGTNLVSLQAAQNSPTQTIQFGLESDKYVAADFDGDGKGDLTVFRPSDGTWWWMRSSDSVVQAQTFGISSDVPVPADYDGDGKTDIAIWREDAQSHFWVFGSQVGVFVLPWGTSGDSVITY